MLHAVLYCTLLTSQAAPSGVALGPAISGKWVSTLSGVVFSVLELDWRNNGLIGVMVAPERFVFDQDQELTEISSEHRKVSLSLKSVKGADLRLTDKSGEHIVVIRQLDRNRIELSIEGSQMPSLLFHRVDTSEKVEVASSLPEPKTPELRELQRKLKEMVTEDQSVRMTRPILASRMQEVDDKHRPILLRIFRQYGWPRISLAGRRTANDYWLLVQHQDLSVQKMVLPAMKRAVDQGEASKANFAYLYDRVMVGEGRAQHWGTQTRCQDHLPVLDPVDDPSTLDKRRAELHLMPVAQYLELPAIVDFCTSFRDDRRR